MDPKEEALECLEMVKRDFAIAHNMPNQAEGIYASCRAKTLLRYLHPHIKCTPDSQTLEESQINKEEACSETRPTKNCAEDVLPNGEQPAKKPRIAQASEVNRGLESSEIRPTEICRKDHHHVKTRETMKAHEPMKFELFAAPGPNHSPTQQSDVYKAQVSHVTVI
jgi:hypothetical protein